MDALVPCPGCGSELRVPMNASGHRARCPACGVHLIVPELNDVIEDTCSNWIEEDVAEVLTLREQMTMEQLRPVRARRPGQRIPGSVSKPPRNPQHSAADGEPVVLAKIPPTPGAGRKPSAPQKPGAQPSTPPPAVPAPAPAAPARSHHPRLAEYPADLAPDAEKPKLVVRDVRRDGASFAFDAKWLEHEGFRASMPVRCAFTGVEDRRKLFARPMLFLDHAQLRNPDPEKLAAGHEQRSLGEWHPRQIMHELGVIERMQPPFHLPMPYYVVEKFSHIWIDAHTEHRHDGGLTCVVTLPDPQTALRWFERVNGVCGDDYEKLEHDIALLHGEAWRALSERCRQRLEVWCKLSPHEVFEAYFIDADFGRHDEGLAGLVVTNERVIFTKYHHRGQVKRSNTDARIVIRTAGPFATLQLAVGGQRCRMVKLHRHDVEPLVALLADGPVQVDVAEEAVMQ